MIEESKDTKKNIENYELVATQLRYLIEGEENVVANLANASALLNSFLDEINWVGFYLLEKDKNELVLGPFQGQPACIRIPLNKGVCGACASTLKVMRVADVHTFEGHIACDPKSKSEIVLPIVIDDTLFGVLDVDSPIVNRFDEDDEIGLKLFVEVLEKHLN